MSFPERLRAFALEGHHKGRVAIRQRHHEERHLAQPAIHVGQRVTEVHLRLTREMLQRHKHLLGLLRQISHRILDHGVAAGEAIRTQPLPNPFGCVPLFARHRLVILQDLFDPFQKSPKLLLRSRFLLPVTRRETVFQNLLQRLTVHPRLPENLPPAHASCQHFFANFGPVFHIAIHASLLMKMPHF